MPVVRASKSSNKLSVYNMQNILRDTFVQKITSRYDGKANITAARDSTWRRPTLAKCAGNVW